MQPVGRQGGAEIPCTYIQTHRHEHGPDSGPAVIVYVCKKEVLDRPACRLPSAQKDMGKLTKCRFPKHGKCERVAQPRKMDRGDTTCACMCVWDCDRATHSPRWGALEQNPSRLPRHPLGQSLQNMRAGCGLGLGGMWKVDITRYYSIARDRRKIKDVAWRDNSHLVP